MQNEDTSDNLELTRQNVLCRKCGVYYSCDQTDKNFIFRYCKSCKPFLLNSNLEKFYL